MSKPSAASLSVVPVSMAERPRAPGDLSGTESALWVAVVDSKPADWFGPDSTPLLKEYVRAVTMCDRFALLVEAELAGDAGEDGPPLKDLMRLRDMEVKRATSLATKLRLTQQSKYQPRGAYTEDAKAGSARPWRQTGS